MKKKLGFQSEAEIDAEIKKIECARLPAVFQGLYYQLERFGRSPLQERFSKKIDTLAILAEGCNSGRKTHHHSHCLPGPGASCLWIRGRHRTVPEKIRPETKRRCQETQEREPLEELSAMCMRCTNSVVVPTASRTTSFRGAALLVGINKGGSSELNWVFPCDDLFFHLFPIRLAAFFLKNKTFEKRKRGKREKIQKLLLNLFEISADFSESLRIAWHSYYQNAPANILIQVVKNRRTSVSARDVLRNCASFSKGGTQFTANVLKNPL